MLSDEAKQKVENHVQGLPQSLRHPPATLEQIQEFENRFGEIPKDYQWFLMQCGGGTFGTEHLDDIVALSHTHKKFSKESSIPRGWTMRNVFIIGWDGSGNPFGIERTTGRILVEDHAFGGIHELAPNLQAFMLKGIWA